MVGNYEKHRQVTRQIQKPDLLVYASFSFPTTVLPGYIFFFFGFLHCRLLAGDLLLAAPQ